MPGNFLPFSRGQISAHSQSKWPPFFQYHVCLSQLRKVKKKYHFRDHYYLRKTMTHIRMILNILTSTKNASLIITDFLAMICKNEQPRTASLCRGWAMLGKGFNLICRRRVIPPTSYRLNVHMTALCIDRL